VAQRAATTSTITSYDRVELVSAFLDQPDRARDLVRRELGALAARDPATERLRETTLAYLRAGGNARDAAVLLGTHKNTVLYRLRSIEEQLGHPVLERRLMLEVALTLVEHLGDGVLPD
jgi:DNA-binding PucR family transcriptional regulator